MKVKKEVCTLKDLETATSSIDRKSMRRFVILGMTEITDQGNRMDSTRAFLLLLLDIVNNSISQAVIDQKDIGDFILYCDASAIISNEKIADAQTKAEDRVDLDYYKGIYGFWLEPLQYRTYVHTRVDGYKDYEPVEAEMNTEIASRFPSQFRFKVPVFKYNYLLVNGEPLLILHNYTFTKNYCQIMFETAYDNINKCIVVSDSIQPKIIGLSSDPLKDPVRTHSIKYRIATATSIWQGVEQVDRLENIELKLEHYEKCFNIIKLYTHYSSGTLSSLKLRSDKTIPKSTNYSLANLKDNHVTTLSKAKIHKRKAIGLEKFKYFSTIEFTDLSNSMVYRDHSKFLNSLVGYIQTNMPPVSKRKNKLSFNKILDTAEFVTEKIDKYAKQKLTVGASDGVTIQGEMINLTDEKYKHYFTPMKCLLQPVIDQAHTDENGEYTNDYVEAYNLDIETYTKILEEYDFQLLDNTDITNYIQARRNLDDYIIAILENYDSIDTLKRLLVPLIQIQRCYENE